MLNFWKRVLEKGTTQKHKEKEFVNALDPRYDGPLCGFVAKIDDSVELEKCCLMPKFADLFQNKLAFGYFKQYLESKALAGILNVWYEITQQNSDNKVICNNINENNNKGSSNNIEKISEATVCNRLPSNISLKDELFRLPDELRDKLQTVIKNYCDNDDVESIEMVKLKDVILQTLEEYWIEYTHSEWHCRYQVELLTSRCISLGDILQHETALSYFMEFLEHEGCQSIVEFWLAATNFQTFVIGAQKSSKYDRNQALNDAISIYEKYLSLQATNPLGFSDNVRYAVEESICDESVGPHPDCFHPAVKTVLAFLRFHCLQPFFSSQHYVHLLSDTIRSSTTVTNHSPTSSISESSVDPKHPLLPKFNPDSVWKCRKQSGLSFGRIDQLGRFQRNIEPDPDPKTESKITKTVKKWVHKTENKAQEEMAWQVAEMVVKDITNVTMGCNLEDDQDEDYEQNFGKPN